MTRTIFGSTSPRCASVSDATLWTMGAAARKMRRASLASSTGPACASSRAVSSSSCTLTVMTR